MTTAIVESDYLIPDDLQKCAKEISAVCRKYRLSGLQATLQPGFQSEFHHKVVLTWSAGRHNETDGIAALIYERTVRVPVK